MPKSRCLLASVGAAGLTLLAGSVLSGCSGDQRTTGTTVQRPPEANAGEKASMEFMKSRMTKGGLTKK